jgi:hypothetical protein
MPRFLIEVPGNFSLILSGPQLAGCIRQPWRQCQNQILGTKDRFTKPRGLALCGRFIHVDNRAVRARGHAFGVTAAQIAQLRNIVHPVKQDSFIWANEHARLTSRTIGLVEKYSIRVRIARDSRGRTSLHALSVCALATYYWLELPNDFVSYDFQAS